VIHLSTKYSCIEEKGESLVISLDRPEVKNAFHPEMISELIFLFKEIEQQKEKISKERKYILLKANGDTFCAGADLNWMRSMKDFSIEENLRDATQLEALFAAIRNSSFPVIGLVQGGCYGGGVGLVAACDLVYAKSNSANFCLSEVKLGLAPAVISPYVMAKVGSSNFRRFALSGELFGAVAAMSAGLVHYVVEEINWIDIENVIASHYAKLPSVALQKVKSLALKLEGPLFSKEVTHFTTNLIAHLRKTPEAQEGMSSVLEKRKPNWIKIK
jgi:methylglutaconyl-CoA hydratase